MHDVLASFVTDFFACSVAQFLSDCPIWLKVKESTILRTTTTQRQRNTNATPTQQQHNNNATTTQQQRQQQRQQQHTTATDSGGSSDSVPRRSLRTFCLATETGTHSANCVVGVRDAAVYGGVHGEVARMGELAALPRFLRSSRSSGVERQPAQFNRRHLWTYTVTSVNL